MGQYIDRTDVELTLKGKVRFTDDDDNEERMSLKLLNRLIDEAEADVEVELSMRYAIPFQGQDGSSFATLAKNPAWRTAARIVRLMCRYRTAMLILDTDFGRGTALDGENFSKQYAKAYQDLVDRAVEKRPNQEWGWKYPPLPNLKLAAHNSQADDGFQGMVMSTNPSHGQTGFAAKQINDPGENFWAGVQEDVPDSK